MARPKFAPKSTASCGPIPKRQYLPHSWTRPTYAAKQCSDPICRFSTMHWTDRRTDRPTHRPTDRPRESSITIGRCATRATRPNKNCSFISQLTIRNCYGLFTPPTRQSRLVSVQFRWVRVGGVNTTADKTRQFCLVSNCVHTANSTRQDSLVSSASAVWTNHYTTSCHAGQHSTIEHKESIIMQPNITYKV